MRKNGHKHADPLLERSAQECSTADASAFPNVSKVGFRDLCDSIWTVACAFFWDEASRCRAWTMASMVLMMMFGFSFLNIWFLQMFRNFQNALHDKDRDLFYRSLLTICIVALGIMPIAALRDGIRGSLALEWRRYLTQNLMRKYIGDSQAYYRLKFQGSDLDNPDQRIAQDTGEFTRALLAFICSILQAVIVILTQSGMLIAISLELFFFVVGYALVVNVGTFWVFGGRLTTVNRRCLAQEASLRFGLVRVRENAEPIAFYQGAGFERARCGEFYDELMNTLYHKLCLTVTFDSVMGVVGMLIGVLPYCVVAGKYFAGELDFGAMSEATAVLSGLAGAFNTLLGEMQAITTMSAQAVRIRQLWDALETISQGHKRKAPDVDDWALSEDGGELMAMAIGLVELPLEHPTGPGQLLLRLEDVTLQPPQGSVPLVRDLSMELRSGESMIVCGPSGIGKSSLLRAIGGLWAGGRGTIERCAASQCFFVPQEPYLCIGSLRENATYPGSPELGTGQPSRGSPADAEIQAALKKVNIGYLLDRFDLDERVDLGTVLSGGERQRLGFARLLLRPPDLRFAILDEATSALDEANEQTVYELLRDRVLGYVSVGHRASLDFFHTHKLLLERTAQGSCSWRVARSAPHRAVALGEWPGAHRAGQLLLESGQDRDENELAPGEGWGNGL